jgi:hypothetical protein
MRAACVVAAMAFLGVGVLAQTETGRIRGTLSSVRGPLAGVEVRIKNIATEQVQTTRTSPAGAFEVSVVAGTYDVFSAPAGYAGFARRQVVVTSGATTQVDGVVADSPNAGTPGEIFFIYQRAERQPPTGPAPRTADGRPDLSGGPDLDPDVPPFQPWAEEAARRQAARMGDDPRAHCLPSGVVRMQALDLAKFVQTPTLLVMLVEGSVPGTRQVFLDGRGHPRDLQPTWLGHSVGKWEGDTLVIDTVGFNDRGWLDMQGRPQTERLHVVERFRRPSLGRMDLEITVDDPGAYIRPWKVRRALDLAAGEEIQEYVCNENNKTDHFVK